MLRKVPVKLRSGEIVWRWPVDARALIEADDAMPWDGAESPASAAPKKARPKRPRQPEAKRDGADNP